ncbi:hypothetical protein Scep_004944 [Stephania cephalantha]|uniref:Uncharacterized protein n=1 Tax=Stephania cephalantha TaxID=152367 RepID=A0AAP0KVW9_9MAGN
MTFESKYFVLSCVGSNENSYELLKIDLIAIGEIWMKLIDLDESWSKSRN